jgi:hypothetical protein
LSAEQAYQQARINLVQAQANRYADTAALVSGAGRRLVAPRGFGQCGGFNQEDMKNNLLHAIPGTAPAQRSRSAADATVPLPP